MASAEQDLSQRLPDAVAQVDLGRPSVETLRRVFDLSPVGMAVFGPDGGLTIANRAFENLLGYSQNQLRQPKPLLLIDTLMKTGDEEVKVDIKKFVNGETEQYSQYRRIENVGKRRLLNVTVSRFQEQDSFPGFVLFAQDVAEAELKGARTAAEYLGHKLNNWLTMVGCYVGFIEACLSEKGLLDQELQGYVERARGAYSSMVDIIKTFGRIRGVKQEDWREVVELAPEEAESGDQSPSQES